MNHIFDDMTTDEQKKWWFEQAQSALKALNVEADRLEWLAYTHNAVFSVISHDSVTVLRLSLAENALQIQSERDILQCFSQAGLNVPTPIHSIETDSISGVLLSYIEGDSPQPDSVTVAEMAKIGAFIANLHQTQIDTTIHRHRLDWDGLYAETGIYYPNAENMAVFTDEQLAVMTAVTNLVKSAMDELGETDSEYGIIHGDFLLKNILFHEGDIHALDFEYCGWGYYLYDLTPLLWQLKPQARYAKLEQALWEGYTSIRPLTKKHRNLLETFIAGRQVASMRWIVANQQNPYIVGKVDAILAQRTAELTTFLETAILKRE